MNTIAAFAMGEAYRGNELKVFDWDKAANIAMRAVERNLVWSVFTVLIFQDMKRKMHMIYTRRKNDKQRTKDTAR